MDKSAFEGSVGGPAALRDGEVVAPQLWYELILRRCGLTFRSARLADVMAIVRDQTKLRGLPNEAAYYQLLSKSEDSATEWDALVERLINHETSFFRHPPSFDAAGSLLARDGGHGRRSAERRVHDLGRRHQPLRRGHREARALRPPRDCEYSG
jgi:hypothetical protein